MWKFPLCMRASPPHSATRRQRLPLSGWVWAISSKTCPTSFPAVSSRVSIARALARGPAVILADEPTGALDSHTSREVLGMLQDLHKQGNTVVLITHDNSIAVQAERIIRLEDGRVVYDGDAHAPEAVVQPNFMMAEPKAGEEGTQA